jgi:phosphoribosylamine--glycine ligase
VTVVLAAEGYPAAPVKGDEITGLDEASKVDGAYILHAGTKLAEDGRLLTNGGRVLNVVGTGPDLQAARTTAYEAMSKITLRASHHRTDIALKAARA